MAYEGEILTSCPSDIDFSVIQAVVVSGAGPNICGHMLLAIGSNSANVWYLHVAFQGVGEVGAIGAIQDGRIWDAVKDYALGNSGILTGYPKFMRGDAAYNRYLEENGKQEIRRLDANITNPNGAYHKLMEFMNTQWCWGVLIHNCATFVREIIVAGGGDLKVLLNCPDQEYLKMLLSKARQAVII